MSLYLRNHKKLWIFLFLLLVVSTQLLCDTTGDPVIKKLAQPRASSLVISYSCHFRYLTISCPYWSKIFGPRHFSALPSQFSESLIFAKVLSWLVFAEVLLCFGPVIFSHSDIAGVISRTLLSDSTAAVYLSSLFSEPDLSASLPASDPSKLGSSSGSSSEGLLVLLAFLLPPLLSSALLPLSESKDGFSFWVRLWVFSLVVVHFPSPDLRV